MSTTCPVCKAEKPNGTCPECMRLETLPRIDGRYLLNEIRSVVAFERGFLFSVRELLARPGSSVRWYLNEDRDRLVKPVLFLIVTSLIYTLLNQVYRFESTYVEFGAESESYTELIFLWIQNNYGYANIIMAVFIGMFVKVFFRRYDINLFEILVMLCYYIGMAMLLLGVVGVADTFTTAGLLQAGGIIAFGYITWAIGQFYDPGKVSSYIKALFAYILGTVSFFVLAILLGVLLDRLP